MNKISIKYILLLFVMVICLGSFICIRPTYSKFTNDYTTDDNIAEFNYDFKLSINNIEEYEIVKVKPNEYTIFNVQVSNDTMNDIYYGIWYMFESADDISISKYTDSENDTSGSIDAKGTKTITLIAVNNGDSSKKIKIGIASSDEDISSIEYLDGKKLVSGISDKPNMESNTPVLDYGMIPVVYNYDREEWIKADSNNTNYSWYNYEDKKWANVVLVSDSSRDRYLNSTIGTSININDVMAFYVWIPRFKYHVWNISRNTNGINNYSYDAYSKGIDIKWESDIFNTGNVACSYSNRSNDLYDSCIYGGDEVISSTSDNKKIKDAWYTHPAFTFGEKEKTGFWIGKFETTGTAQIPTVLPDQRSLVNNNVSTQFTISRKFQNYGLTTDLDAHVVRNLEWGALTYLTYSKYGLCKKSGCRDVYINNSSELYTGRSGGNISGSNEIQMNSVYNDVLDNTNKYNSSGYYNYQGYMYNSNGELTSFKNINKIASSTGNITGVYDLVGGASEVVMANGSTSTNLFNVGSAGTNWNSNSNLSSYYYDKYAYSNNGNNYKIARLGDASGENSVLNSNSLFVWKPLVSSSGVNVSNVMDTSPWLIRGGSYKDNKSIFSFDNYNGNGSSDVTFRSVLS